MCQGTHVEVDLGNSGPAQMQALHVAYPVILQNKVWTLDRLAGLGSQPGMPSVSLLGRDGKTFACRAEGTREGSGA